MPKEDKIIFDVTDDHLKLVRRLHFQVGFCEDPCAHALEAWPAVNRKRPLGNDGAVYDMCGELGWLSPDGDVPENKKTPALLAEMERFFGSCEDGRRILEIFRDEAVRRYEAFHGNPGHDRAAVLSMLKSGTAGMEPTWAGWPF